MKEHINEMANSGQGLFNISTSVWLFIVSGVGGLLWTAVRIFFRVGHLEEHMQAVQKQNEAQNELFKELFQINKKTDVAVAQIQGMLGSRKTDHEEQ